MAYLATARSARSADLGFRAHRHRFSAWALHCDREVAARIDTEVVVAGNVGVQDELQYPSAVTVEQNVLKGFHVTRNTHFSSVSCKCHVPNIHTQCS